MSGRRWSRPGRSRWATGQSSARQHKWCRCD